MARRKLLGSSRVKLENIKELSMQLLEDVDVLQDHFLTERPKPSNVRAVFVPILRRWIAEGTFHHIQKAILPNKVIFELYSEGFDIKLCKAGIFDYWMGLTEISGIAVSSGLVNEKHREDLKRSPSSNRPHGPTKFQHPASVFFDQKIFFWDRVFYTRSDVVKFHANALGGVHFNFRRAETEIGLSKLKNLFGYEVVGSNYQMLVGDAIEAARGNIARRPHVYDAIELMSLDTARIFFTAIKNHQNQIRNLII
jgi:hypothetical protein